jgi:hypothetical protein
MVNGASLSREFPGTDKVGQRRFVIIKMATDFEQELDQIIKSVKEAGRREATQWVRQSIYDGAKISIWPEFADDELFEGINDAGRLLNPPFGGKEPFCQDELDRRQRAVDYIKDKARKLFADSLCSIRCQGHSAAVVDPELVKSDLDRFNRLAPSKFQVTFENNKFVLRTQ